MWTDVLDLNEFYRSTLGQTTVRLLRARLREVWPNVRGETVLGLGYAAPFLRPFIEESQRTLAFMPAQQGVTRWPREGRNLTALVDEMDLPLPDRSVDRVLLIHAIECTEQVRPMLREIWRVMADGGRLIVVAPTRAGLWSQIDRSPFYQGHPYSPGQLAALMRVNMFAPLRQTRALFMPPTRSRLAMRMAPAVERFGQRWLGRFAGVSVIESGKQLYAGIAERSQAPAVAVVRPKLRIASSRDTAGLPGAARNAGDGEAPAS
jgi:SAM-dependent methyltransferase